MGKEKYDGLWLHVSLLWSLCVVQPIYERIVTFDTLFSELEATPIHVALFILCVGYFMPICTWILHVLGRGLGTRFRQAVNLLLFSMFAVLVGLVLMQLLESWSGSAALSIVVVLFMAVAGATVMLMSYVRLRPLRTWLSAVAPVLFIIPVWCLFGSPVSLYFSKVSSPVSEVALKSKPESIVMIVFDEMPLTSIINHEGQIDSKRYPPLHNSHHKVRGIAMR